MAGDEFHFVAQREENVADGSNQGRMIPTGKIGAPDGAFKNYVPHLQQAAGTVVEDHMTGRVTGAVQHFQFHLAKADTIAMHQPAIRCERRHGGEAEHAALLGHALDPEAVLLVRPFDRDPSGSRQGGDPTGMVDMAMGDENLDQLELFGRQKGLNTLDIAPGIDHGGFTGAFAPEDGAILGKGRYRNDVIAHAVLGKEKTARIIAPR